MKNGKRILSLVLSIFLMLTSIGASAEAVLPEAEVPAIVEEQPVAEEEQPVAEEEQPAVEEEQPVVEEEPTVAEEIPAAEEQPEDKAFEWNLAINGVADAYTPYMGDTLTIQAQARPLEMDDDMLYTAEWTLETNETTQPSKVSVTDQNFSDAMLVVDTSAVFEEIRCKLTYAQMDGERTVISVSKTFTVATVARPATGEISLVAPEKSEVEYKKELWVKVMAEGDFSNVDMTTLDWDFGDDAISSTKLSDLSYMVQYPAAKPEYQDHTVVLKYSLTGGTDILTATVSFKTRCVPRIYSDSGIDQYTYLSEITDENWGRYGQISAEFGDNTSWGTPNAWIDYTLEGDSVDLDYTQYYQENEASLSFSIKIKRAGMTKMTVKASCGEDKSCVSTKDFYFYVLSEDEIAKQYGDQDKYYYELDETFCGNVLLPYPKVGGKKVTEIADAKVSFDWDNNAELASVAEEADGWHISFKPFKGEYIPLDLVVRVGDYRGQATIKFYPVSDIDKLIGMRSIPGKVSLLRDENGEAQADVSVYTNLTDLYEYIFMMDESSLVTWDIEYGEGAEEIVSVKSVYDYMSNDGEKSLRFTAKKAGECVVYVTVTAKNLADKDITSKLAIPVKVEDSTATALAMQMTMPEAGYFSGIDGQEFTIPFPACAVRPNDTEIVCSLETEPQLDVSDGTTGWTVSGDAGRYVATVTVRAGGLTRTKNFMIVIMDEGGDEPEYGDIDLRGSSYERYYASDVGNYTSFNFTYVGPESADGWSIMRVGTSSEDPATAGAVVRSLQSWRAGEQGAEVSLRLVGKGTDTFEIGYGMPGAHLTRTFTVTVAETNDEKKLFVDVKQRVFQAKMGDIVEIPMPTVYDEHGEVYSSVGYPRNSPSGMETMDCYSDYIYVGRVSTPGPKVFTLGIAGEEIKYLIDVPNEDGAYGGLVLCMANNISGTTARKDIFLGEVYVDNYEYCFDDAKKNIKWSAEITSDKDIGTIRVDYQGGDSAKLYLDAKKSGMLRYVVHATAKINGKTRTSEVAGSLRLYEYTGGEDRNMKMLGLPSVLTVRVGETATLPIPKFVPEGGAKLEEAEIYAYVGEDDNYSETKICDIGYGSVDQNGIKITYYLESLRFGAVGRYAVQIEGYAIDEQMNVYGGYTVITVNVLEMDIPDTFTLFTGEKNVTMLYEMNSPVKGDAITLISSDKTAVSTKGATMTAVAKTDVGPIPVTVKTTKTGYTDTVDVYVRRKAQKLAFADKVKWYDASVEPSGETLTAVITPADVKETITYASSDPSVIDIDPKTGALDFKREGAVTITASATYGLTATCRVVYRSTPQESIGIAGSDTLAVKEQGQYSATVISDATQDFAWSLEDVTPKGAVVFDAKKAVLTAKKVGTAKLVATLDNGLGTKAEKVITVVPQTAKVAMEYLPVGSEEYVAVPAAGITLTTNGNPSEELIDCVIVRARITPDAAKDGIEWRSSNDAVARCESGKIVARGKGSCVITALTLDGSGKKAQVKINVVERCEGLIVTAADHAFGGEGEPDYTVIVAKGKKIQMKAAAINPGATNQKVTWSLDAGAKGFITISKTGLVTAKKPTTTAVKLIATATDGSGVRASALVEVLLPVTSVTLFDALGNKAQNVESVMNDPSKLVESFELTSKVTPDSLTTYPFCTFASSDESIATVAVNEITGKATVTVHNQKVGKAVISATAMDGTGKKASVVVSSVNHLLFVGEGEEISVAAGKKATLKPDYNDDATDKTIIWTSANPKIAKVDKKGVVTAQKTAAGKTTEIFAESNDGGMHKYTYTVHVTALSKTLTIEGGKANVVCNYSAKNAARHEMRLTAKVAEGASTSVVWSNSNPTAVQTTVDATGVDVKPIGVGDAVITAQATDGSGLKASFTIHVGTEPKLIDMDLTEGIAEGRAVPAMVTGYLEDGKTLSTIQEFVFESDNPAIAAVNEHGIVTGISEGSTQIRALYYPNDTEVIGYGCNVQVFPAAIESVEIRTSTGAELNEENTTLWVNKPGEPSTRKYVPVLQPQSDAYGIVEWMSSDPEVATVDQSGLVTAIGFGTAIISCMAQDGSAEEASFMVLCNRLAEQGDITIEGYDVCGLGKSIQMSAVVNNATSGDVRWKVRAASGDAHITQDGVLTGIKEGSVSVVATATDGSEVSTGTLVYILPAIESIKVVRWDALGFDVEMPNVYTVKLGMGKIALKSSERHVVWSTNAAREKAYLQIDPYNDEYMDFVFKAKGTYTVTVTAADNNDANPVRRTLTIKVK